MRPPYDADAEPASASAAPAEPGGVRVRFTGQSRVRVRGPASGADYVFSGSEPVRTVAGADVPGLLGTGYFRRAY
jgi:hypothetical protein